MFVYLIFVTECHRQKSFDGENFQIFGYYISSVMCELGLPRCPLAQISVPAVFEQSETHPPLPPSSTAQ